MSEKLELFTALLLVIPKELYVFHNAKYFESRFLRREHRAIYCHRHCRERAKSRANLSHASALPDERASNWQRPPPPAVDTRPAAAPVPTITYRRRPDSLKTSSVERARAARSRLACDRCERDEMAAVALDHAGQKLLVDADDRLRTSPKQIQDIQVNDKKTHLTIIVRSYFARSHLQFGNQNLQ